MLRFWESGLQHMNIGRAYFRLYHQNLDFESDYGMKRVWAWNAEVLTWEMIAFLLTKRSQTTTLISCDSIRRISNILILVGLSTLLTLNTETSRKGPPPLPTADITVVFPFTYKLSEAFPDILFFSYLGTSQFLIFIYCYKSNNYLRLKTELFPSPSLTLSHPLTLSLFLPWSWPLLKVGTSQSCKNALPTYTVWK